MPKTGGRIKSDKLSKKDAPSKPSTFDPKTAFKVEDSFDETF